MTRQRPIFFLVVCVLGFYGEIFGQKNTLKGESFAGYVSVPIKPLPFQPKFKSTTATDMPHGRPAFLNFQLVNLPSEGYYVSCLGFICKKELQLDKITPVRLRFRLGCLDYVNWLEQKPNPTRN